MGANCGSKFPIHEIPVIDTNLLTRQNFLQDTNSGASSKELQDKLPLPATYFSESLEISNFGK
jgi:hypothetical protein